MGVRCYVYFIPNLICWNFIVIMSAPRQIIKTAAYTHEPVFIDVSGVSVPYIPKEIVDHRKAYSVTLDLLFKHVADFHINMIAIIAEKYNLDAAEMINVVSEDPRYEQMLLHPVIESLGHFGKEDLEKQIPTTKNAPLTEPIVEPKKVVMKLKKKKATASSETLEKQT